MNCREGTVFLTFRPMQSIIDGGSNGAKKPISEREARGIIMKTCSILPLLIAPLLFSCSGKQASPTGGGGGDSLYADLHNKDDVLVNLILSYEHRNIAEYARLLDDDFVFFFSSYDSTAGFTPGHWDRSMEIEAADSLFDMHMPLGTLWFWGSSPGYEPAESTPPNAPPPGRKNTLPAGLPAGDGSKGSNPYITWGRIKKSMIESSDSTSYLQLDLYYQTGDSAWTEIQPPSSSAAETWYEKRVKYDLRVVSGTTEFTSYNFTAAFYVRPAVAGGDTTWRIVRWYDDPR